MMQIIRRHVAKMSIPSETVTRVEPHHVGRLEGWVLVEGGTPEAALEDLDEVENEARPDLHQRAVLLNDLQHRTKTDTRVR